MTKGESMRSPVKSKPDVPKRDKGRRRPAARLKGSLLPAAARGEYPTPFWKKPLEAFDKSEWESLCDGCGRCCLVKLEDEDTGLVHFTDIGCKLLDSATCRCTDYAQRRRRVRDCIRLDPATVRALPWLPPTCAYRLIAEGRDLPAWHPLVSGTHDSVVAAGISVRGRVAASEADLPLDQYPAHIVSWPGKVPKAAKGLGAGKGSPKKA